MIKYIETDTLTYYPEGFLRPNKHYLPTHEYIVSNVYNKYLYIFGIKIYCIEEEIEEIGMIHDFHYISYEFEREHKIIKEKREEYFKIRLRDKTISLLDI